MLWELTEGSIAVCFTLDTMNEASPPAGSGMDQRIHGHLLVTIDISPPSSKGGRVTAPDSRMSLSDLSKQAEEEGGGLLKHRPNLGSSRLPHATADDVHH